MSSRCINQHLSEQFRRVIASNFVIVSTGCSRGCEFSAALKSQKARVTNKFTQLSISRVGAGAGAGARYSSSSALLETLRGCDVGSVSYRNFQIQRFSGGLYGKFSTSSVVVVGFRELRAPQYFCSSAVSAMSQTKKLELKDLGKALAVWKEKPKVRDVSTAAEVCSTDAETTPKAAGNDEGTNSPGDPNGGPTTDSIYSAKQADQEVAPEESVTKEVHVDAMLLRFLVGKGGSTKEKIEKDNKVKLKIPSTHEVKTSKSGCTITGTETGIEAAQKQIKRILDEAVQSKLQYTHFISLPLASHPDLLEQVQQFQERILARNQPTRATSSGGGESGISNKTKEKAAVNGEEVKSPKAEISDIEKVKSVLQCEVKCPELDILETENQKDAIMDEVESPEASTPDTKKRSFLNIEKGVLEEESVSKAEVTDMEKGVVEVKVTPNKSGIDKSIFVKPRTFHLTVLMLKLWNGERVQQAAEVLEKVQAAVHDALEGRPTVLDFKGVETMKGKPEKAHVLFARVEDSAEKTRLLQACQVLIDAYVESGLVMEKDIGHSLKLHATLMNTTHRTVKKNHRFGRRIPFDATEILEQYGDWKWGEFVIQEAHLSQRFVYDENGYYHRVQSIHLPT